MATFSFFNEAKCESCESILPSVEFDTILNKADIEAAVEESAFEAGCRACMENTRNWNAIMQACAITEFAHFEATGEEFVYEGTNLDSFFEKAKEFFRNIWKKIQEIFKSAVAQFAAWFKTDKEFVNKYEKLLDRSYDRGFGDKEVSIYPYKALTETPKSVVEGLKFIDGAESFFDDAMGGKIENAISGGDVTTLEAVAKECTDEYIDGVLDKVRGKLCGATETSAKDFGKDYTEYLTGDKEDVKLGEALKPAMEFLKNSAAVKEALNKALKDSKEQIDKSIKAIEDDQKKLTKENTDAKEDVRKVNNGKHTLMSKRIKVDREAKNILTKACAVQIDCMKKASRQSKAVCMKALTYSDKSDKDNKRESVLHTESAMQLVNDLQLI